RPTAPEGGTNPSHGIEHRESSEGRSRRTFFSASIARRHRNGGLSNLPYGGFAMKHITTAAALLALVSAPALGNPLCTDSESSCITVNGTIGGVTFTAASGNALEVSSSG